MKLTDYGVHNLFREMSLRDDIKMKPASAESPTFLPRTSLSDDEGRGMSELLHLAPELLSISVVTKGPDREPTPECDIYSLGMIMYKIATRNFLYDYDKHTEEGE